MYRRTIICTAVLCVLSGASVASPAAHALASRPGGGTVLGSGFHRDEQASIAINADGAAFATWEAGGLYSIPSFSTRPAAGNWRSSRPMYSPSSYVLSAAVDSTGRAVAIYSDDGTEGIVGTYLISATAGKRGWTKERKILRDQADAASMSANGHIALFENLNGARAVDLLTETGHRQARVVIGDGDRFDIPGSIVANNDGSAIAAFDEEVPGNQRPTCWITRVVTVQPNGRIAGRASLAQRCGGYPQSHLTASTSGQGAVLTWPIPGSRTHPRRFGVGVLDGSRIWKQRTLPAEGGQARLIAPAVSGRRVSVWWTVRNGTGTSIYLVQNHDGQWNRPVLVRHYGTGTPIVDLVAALHGRRHLVAWTASPDGQRGRHINRMRFTAGNRVRAATLGAGETVLQAAAKGHHLALLTARRMAGKHSEQIVFRQR